MADADIGPEAREVVRRLSAVDLSEDALDASRAASALEEFFRRLGLARLPVRWAHSARHAERLAEEARPGRAAGRISKALGAAAKRDGKASALSSARGKALLDAMRAYSPGVWREVRRAVDSSTVIAADWGANSRPNSRIRLWELGREAAADAAMAAAELARLHDSGGGAAPARAFAEIKLPMLDAYETGLWLYWVAPEEIIALRRPSVAVREGRLHREGGPAVSWPNGESYYFLNGVRVPDAVALTPADELSPQLVLEARNAGVRREIVRKIGLRRVLECLDAKLLDRRGDYELLSLDLRDGRYRPFLKMKNPSTGDIHIEGVHPNCTTVKEALAWRNGTDIPPAVLT